jgi:hypothetical protein
MVLIGVLVVLCALACVAWRRARDRRAWLGGLLRCFGSTVTPMEDRADSAVLLAMPFGMSVIAVPTATPTDGSQREAMLAARFLAGDVDRAAYQREMAELAAEDAAAHPLVVPSEDP